MQNMGRAGEVEPYSSVWIPNFILLAVIIYTSYKMQKDLPFRLTGWVANRAMMCYEIFMNISSKLLPSSHHQDIKPLKYGRNRQILNETTKKILQEKMRNLK